MTLARCHTQVWVNNPLLGACLVLKQLFSSGVISPYNSQYILFRGATMYDILALVTSTPVGGACCTTDYH